MEHLAVSMKLDLMLRKANSFAEKYGIRKFCTKKMVKGVETGNSSSWTGGHWNKSHNGDSKVKELKASGPNGVQG